MNNKNSELLNTQTGQTTTQNNENLIQRHEIPNTPFTHIEYEGNHFLTYGRYKISENFDNPADMDEWMNKNQWHIIAMMAGIIADFKIEEMNSNK